MVELSLDLGLVYVPKGMSEFLGEVSKIGDGFQKLSMIDDYVKRLEDEMRKIDAFKRELPLCMLLLTDAIGRLKEEEIRCKELNSGSEEVSPFKRNLEEDEISDKKNWMSSVQLWNSDISCDQKKQDEIPKLKQRSEKDDPSVSENPIQLCNNTNRDREGAFVPYKGQPGITGLSLMSPISELISCNSGLKNNSSSRFGCLSENKNQMKAHSKPQQQQQPQNSRKQRRCWSPDLHRRFVEALRQLGGSQVATPKQIRELMQVDGLTNDEVKSHLQKYRLHIRRLPAAEANGPRMVQDQCNDQMKGSSSQSSPQGPLLASGSGKGTSSTGGNSMEAEEEEEEKSDGQSWRGGVHKSRETAV